MYLSGVFVLLNGLITWLLCRQTDSLVTLSCKVKKKRKKKKNKKKKETETAPKIRPMRKRPVGPTGIRHARGLSATSAVIPKHGGVHSTAPGCQRSPVDINFSHSVNITLQCRRYLRRCPGVRGSSSPPLRVQIQLQRTAFVSNRRRDPVLDPHWK